MRYYELFEAKVGDLDIGEYHVIVDSHTVDRAVQRFVSPRAVDRTLKKIPQIGNRIDQIANSMQFYIVDQTEGISLGFRKTQGKEMIFKTVIDSTKPYAKGVEDIITVD